MLNFPLFRRDIPQDLLPLELKILSRGPSQPQHYKIQDGKTLKKIFPSSPPSIQSLKFSPDIYTVPEPLPNKPQPKNAVDPQGLKILRLRGIAPHLNSNSRNAVSFIQLPCWRYSLHGWGIKSYQGISDASLEGLNQIFKQAKNLRSLILHPECGLSDLKGLRKARNLRNLSLTLSEKQLLGDPKLLKKLIYLEKVSLNIRCFPKDSSKMLSFLDILLSLPKLEHFTVKGEDNWGHYKSLIALLQAKNFPSFHIIRDVSPHLVYAKSPIYWGNCIDTLHLGPINQHHHMYSSQKTPERRLSLKSPLCFESDLLDLQEGSTTIKTLFVINPFPLQPNFDEEKPLLEFLSKMKCLENLTLTFETSFTNFSVIMNGIIGRFSMVEESFGNLKTLNFSLKNENDSVCKLLPPYGSAMKNLKIVDVRLVCKDLDLSYYMEGLKDLGNLEELQFSYEERSQEREEIDCDLPLESLKNLKKLTLTFNVRFSGASTEKFIEGIHQLKELMILSVSSMVLVEIGNKKAERLIEDLRGMKNLESLSFAWMEEFEGCLVEVCQEKGEIKIIKGD